MKTSHFVLAVAAAAVLACGEKKTEQPKIDLQGELQRVKALHAQHLAKAEKVHQLRQELAKLREKSKLSDAEVQQKLKLEEEVKAASRELDQIFTEDQNALAAFLNTALNDAPQTPETLEGLKIYAQDAILNAREYMNEAGDYRKAVELLETAEGYFAAISATPPDELKELLEEAKRLRFITKERFDAVKKGMTKAEVRAITGTPLALNVREQEVKGQKVTVWLFRSEEGDIASFFFNQKGQLYSKDWKHSS
ncbi:MAG: hypothetical protein ACUVRY_01190 [Thermoanaerobaculaceae bacterium]